MPPRNNLQPVAPTTRVSCISPILLYVDLYMLQVMEEGEKLSKKQLTQETTIRKLRSEIREMQAEHSKVRHQLKSCLLLCGRLDSGLNVQWSSDFDWLSLYERQGPVRCCSFVEICPTLNSGAVPRLCSGV